MRWTPVLGIVLAFSVRPFRSLIMPTEFLSKQAMMAVWRNCIGDTLARTLELQRKDAVSDCRNDDLIDINDIRAVDDVENDDGVRKGEADFNLDELAKINVRTNSDETSFTRQNGGNFPRLSDNSVEDSREFNSGVPKIQENKKYSADWNSPGFQNPDSYMYYNEDDLYTNGNSELNNKENKNNNINRQRNRGNGSEMKQDGNLNFNRNNAANINAKSDRTADTKRTNNPGRRRSNKNHFPIFDLLSPKKRPSVSNENAFLRSRKSDDQKPVYFTLIDQVPFLLQNEEKFEFSVRPKRQSPPIRPVSFSVEELIEGENELKEHLSNFSCVMRQLNLIDRSGNLQMAKIINDIEEYPIDPALKSDLLETAQDCWTLANSLPNDDDENLIPETLEKAYYFFKCSETRRLLSCFKKDIRDDIRAAVPPNRMNSFSMERTVNRILYIKMANSFSDILSVLS